MELTTLDLLTYLPLAIAAGLASRMILGVRTIGTFAPALLALAVMQLGLRQAAAALLVTLGAALLVTPAIDRLRLPRPSRLGFLALVVLVALVVTGAVDASGSAAPVVVLAIVLERTWDAAHADSVRRAVTLLINTVIVAVGIAAGLAALSPPLVGLGPTGAALVGGSAILLVGSYRGLRLSEIVRFRPVIGAVR